MGSKDDNYDLFLVLTRRDGQEVYGESTDAYLQTDPDTGEFQGPIEISNFTFDLEKAGLEHARKGGRTERAPSFKGIKDEKLRKFAESAYDAGAANFATLEEITLNAEERKGKLKREHKFSINKDVDSVSTELFRAYCEGLLLAADAKAGDDGDGDDSAAVIEGVFSKAVVAVRKAAGDPDNVFLKFEFENLNVCHFSIDVSETDHNEKVEFTFDKVTLTYRDQDDTGQLGGASGPSTANAYSIQVAEIDFSKKPAAKVP